MAPTPLQRQGLQEEAEKAYNSLLKRFAKHGLAATDIACQGSCVGPTLVLIDADGPRWFEDLRSSKAQHDVVESAVRVNCGKSMKTSNRLSKRELTGKQLKRASKRLTKALGHGQ